eukprot:3937759-Prymnesium_polylepis.1
MAVTVRQVDVHHLLPQQPPHHRLVSVTAGNAQRPAFLKIVDHGRSPRWTIQDGLDNRQVALPASVHKGRHPVPLFRSGHSEISLELLWTTPAQQRERPLLVAKVAGVMQRRAVFRFVPSASLLLGSGKRPPRPAACARWPYTAKEGAQLAHGGPGAAESHKQDELGVATRMWHLRQQADDSDQEAEHGGHDRVDDEEVTAKRITHVRREQLSDGEASTARDSCFELLAELFLRHLSHVLV